ncbi:NAD(P)-dependent oxidoreductase [Clostridium sp. LBM24168]
MIEKQFVTLLSEKINVLIVGGGRAAAIKLKTFIRGKCNVMVVAPAFSDYFKKFGSSLKLNIICGEYDKKYIYDRHIVVIATDDSKLNSAIRRDCEDLFKLYIDVSDPPMGNCIMPCQRNTKNIHFGVNTEGISPLTSVFIADIMKKNISRYDDFVDFASGVRNSLPGGVERRKIMSFICSEDFYFFYRKNKARIIIDMFYKN